MWENIGKSRPPQAAKPGPGQESVWDYPRPPRLVRDAREVLVEYGDQRLATTTASWRVLETASPPTFYLPPDDIATGQLVGLDHATVCEWKGRASYWAHQDDPHTPIAWSYPRPRPRFDAIRGYFGFYPGRCACYVAGERVRPQAGGFYGGWITAEIVGPFKGEPGTGHW